jgi:hypothetical protein
MTDTNEGPIEVWLTQKNLEITCRVVHEDESVEMLGVDSLSMRGAQREMTGWYISKGYAPVGRWESAWNDDRNGEGETFRRFKPTEPRTSKMGAAVAEAREAIRNDPTRGMSKLEAAIAEGAPRAAEELLGGKVAAAVKASGKKTPSS